MFGHWFIGQYMILYTLFPQGITALFDEDNYYSTRNINKDVTTASRMVRESIRVSKPALPKSSLAECKIQPAKVRETCSAPWRVLNSLRSSALRGRACLRPDSRPGSSGIRSRKTQICVSGFDATLNRPEKRDAKSKAFSTSLWVAATCLMEEFKCWLSLGKSQGGAKLHSLEVVFFSLFYVCASDFAGRILIYILLFDMWYWLKAEVMLRLEVCQT